MKRQCFSLPHKNVQDVSEMFMNWTVYESVCMNWTVMNHTWLPVFALCGCVGVCVVRALLFEGVPGCTLSLSHVGGPDSSCCHCLWARVPPHTTGPCLCSHRGTISSSSSCLCLAAFSGSLSVTHFGFILLPPPLLSLSHSLSFSPFFPPWFCK